MHLTQRSLLPIIIIVAFLFGCNSDPPQYSEKKQNGNSETTKSQLQKKKRNLLGASMFGWEDDYSREVPPIPRADSVKIKNYFCESKKSKNGKICITLYRRGKKIHSDCRQSEGISSFSILMAPPAGTDINGDGIPDIIVDYYSGGAHCCSEYAIYSLGKQLKRLDVLEGKHGNFEFKDLDRDKKYEAIGNDWAFAYWSESFDRSPAPGIILRWKNGKYHFAEKLMKKSYNRKEILKMAEEFKSEQYVLPYSKDDKSLHVEAEVVAAMLELIYSGNGNLAWEFLEHVWLKSEDKLLNKRWQSEKKLFLYGFKAQLKNSLYWADLRKLNGW